MYKQHELESLGPAGLQLFQERNGGIDNANKNKNKTNKIL